MAMNKDSNNNTELAQEQTETTGIQLPGFVNDDDIGLGDVVKQVTSAFGIRPCGDCERRAARLNRWLVFTGRRPK
jgi:hypothetical protein